MSENIYDSLIANMETLQRIARVQLENIDAVVGELRAARGLFTQPQPDHLHQGRDHTHEKPALGKSPYAPNTPTEFTVGSAQEPHYSSIANGFLLWAKSTGLNDEQKFIEQYSVASKIAGSLGGEAGQAFVKWFLDTGSLDVARFVEEQNKPPVEQQRADVGKQLEDLTGALRQIVDPAKHPAMPDGPSVDIPLPRQEDLIIAEICQLFDNKLSPNINPSRFRGFIQPGAGGLQSYREDILAISQDRLPNFPSGFYKSSNGVANQFMVKLCNFIVILDNICTTPAIALYVIDGKASTPLLNLTNLTHADLLNLKGELNNELSRYA